MTAPSNPNINLTYLNRYDMKDDDAGLSEPSGLALAADQRSFWTVSDDTKKIFKIGLNGKLKYDESFDISDAELEGICLDPSGDVLLVVKEVGNEVIAFDIRAHKCLQRRKLAEMDNYESVAAYFEAGDSNKGLEGITCHGHTESVFVMKEGKPGLLIELTSDLKTIRNHTLLNTANGFWDPEVSLDKLDFSDLCYDALRNCFWIISDKAQRLFRFDWQQNRVIQSAKLSYAQNGEYQTIHKAEGVAIAPAENRLYVASDEEAMLYVFDLRD